MAAPERPAELWCSVHHRFEPRDDFSRVQQKVENDSKRYCLRRHTSLFLLDDAVSAQAKTDSSFTRDDEAQADVDRAFRSRNDHTFVHSGKMRTKLDSTSRKDVLPEVTSKASRDRVSEGKVSRKRVLGSGARQKQDESEGEQEVKLRKRRLRRVVRSDSESGEAAPRHALAGEQGASKEASDNVLNERLLETRRRLRKVNSSD
eukprot:TRINITY_DN14076_c0_g1_i1.p1 TRINITY_DN14076_c0_g1~~TRINITY_DN14076_c0_g1_i1.p1  ORF type:complete len:204 (+),score=33.11 TRINITY_DN14076_c0_g1_i1:72-683(+)